MACSDAYNLASQILNAARHRVKHSKSGQDWYLPDESIDLQIQTLSKKYQEDCLKRARQIAVDAIPPDAVADQMKIASQRLARHIR